MYNVSGFLGWVFFKENPMTFILYVDQAGQWRWTLVASNNRRIADSGEGYRNKADCLHGINLVQGTNVLTPVRTA